MNKTVVVTGASSGIGEAAARLFAKEGFRVIVGARRMDRLKSLADEIGAIEHELDVTDIDSVEAFCNSIDECHVLVNNAGGAFGKELIAESVDEKWLDMFEVNVLGTMRMTRALLPKLIASGDGHVINMCSIASHFTYVGGAGYTAAKHAEHAVNDTLRKELLGEPVRVTEIDPGNVETEFSLVRFGGDAERAAEVNKGMTPLVAEDIAECVVWCATRPSHVNIDSLIVTPRDQVVGFAVNRSKDKK